MAYVIFKIGEFFIFDNGVGVAITECTAVLVEGGGGNSGYEIYRGDIPIDAVTVEEDKLLFGPRMALLGALASDSVRTKRFRT